LDLEQVNLFACGEILARSIRLTSLRCQKSADPAGF
jgi:hypothetical protein